MFGWCMASQHNACPEKIQRWQHERGRVVALDDFMTCNCKCHGKKTKKPVRRRRKK